MDKNSLIQWSRRLLNEDNLFYRRSAQMASTGEYKNLTVMRRKSFIFIVKDSPV
jgi:hypothetical protein